MDIEEGQTAYIVTDSLGDEELEGEVTYVSPVGTSGQTMGSASGTASYEIQITINAVSYTHLDVYKRQGMGLCQGQTCAKLVKGIVARELGVSPAELEPTTSRAPVRPIEMRVFAKEGKGDGADE